MLTLGGPPPLRDEPSRGHSPGKRRGENGVAVGAGQEGEGEDLSTVVYKKSKIYAACTVRLLGVYQCGGGMGFPFR